MSNAPTARQVTQGLRSWLAEPHGPDHDCLRNARGVGILYRTEAAALRAATKASEWAPLPSPATIEAELRAGEIA